MLREGPSCPVAAIGVVKNCRIDHSTSSVFLKVGKAFSSRFSDELFRAEIILFLYLVGGTPKIRSKGFLYIPPRRIVLHPDLESVSICLIIFCLSHGRWDAADLAFFRSNGLSQPATWSRVKGDFYIHRPEGVFHWTQVCRTLLMLPSSSPVHGRSLFVRPRKLYWR